MGFFDHLDEFRRRLTWTLIVVFTAAMVAYFFALDVMGFLLAPVQEAAANMGLELELVVLNPMEAFVLRFKVAIYVALVVTSPFWLYQLLSFITPALRPKERRWFYPGLGAMVFFFIAGNVFCYNYVLAPGFTWMIAQAGGLMTVLPKATEYVNFTIYFLLGFGLAFQTPVVVFVLTRLNIITPDALLAQWRWATVVIMVIAAIATPDWSPVTMGALSAAMLVLFFGAAFLAKWTTKKSPDEEEDDFDA